MSTKKNKKKQSETTVEEIVDNLTLFDDDLMSIVFDGNIPATELLLKIVLERNDIKVLSVVGQKELKNPVVGGRNIRLDILAEDGQGEQFNVEVQRKDSYMIMITQNDYFSNGLPIYTVNRHIEELKVRFEDGSHIVYVNGSYKGDDPIGRLMHDFNCKKSKDMYHKELADGVRHFKEEGGRKLVCEAVEKYAEEAAKKAAIEAVIKTEIKAGIAYNIDKAQIIARVQEECDISKEEAEKLYKRYAKSIA